MKRSILLWFASVLLAGCLSLAQGGNTIEYLCADWGPAMKLPAKKGEKLQFSDTEEEIYFLKQIRLGRQGGTGIYVCKMKADGSEKTEIKELWHNPAYPIDTQDQSTWMDVNPRTKQIALSITLAGSDITGLWTMNLDGSDLKRIITPERKKYLQAINHPSWTPDGAWIFFEEEHRGPMPPPFHVAKCDAEGKHTQRLLEATENEAYQQPCVSPDGQHVAFVKHPNWKRSGASHLWLMNVDGSNLHPLLNEKGKAIGGTWPAWSPDGSQIFIIGGREIIVSVATGKMDWVGVFSPHSPGWCHWGKQGFVGNVVGGIVWGDAVTKQTKPIGASHGGNDSRW